MSFEANILPTKPCVQPKTCHSLKGVHFSEPGHMLSTTKSVSQPGYTTRPSAHEVPDPLHMVGSLWVLLLGFIAVPSTFHHHRGRIAGSSYTVRFACLHDILVLSYEALQPICSRNQKDFQGPLKSFPTSQTPSEAGVGFHSRLPETREHWREERLKL